MSQEWKSTKYGSYLICRSEESNPHFLTENVKKANKISHSLSTNNKQQIRHEKKVVNEVDNKVITLVVVEGAGRQDLVVVAAAAAQ